MPAACPQSQLVAHRQSSPARMLSIRSNRPPPFIQRPIIKIQISSRRSKKTNNSHWHGCAPPSNRSVCWHHASSNKICTKCTLRPAQRSDALVWWHSAISRDACATYLAAVSDQTKLKSNKTRSHHSSTRAYGSVHNHMPWSTKERFW